MRILGLDVGERRIGVALSDESGVIAGRLTLIERRGLAADLETVRQLVERHGVTTVVVGLPLTMRGTRGPQAQRVTAFAQQLSRRLSQPVEFVDERLTTVQGQRVLRDVSASRQKRRQTIDQIAAQLILQQFLDARRDADTPAQ